MNLDRIERTGDRERRLRAYRRRGLLVERGLPLVSEMCDDGAMSNARRWLRHIVDARPNKRWTGWVSTQITRTVGDGQPHRSEPIDGGCYYTPAPEHPLRLWLDMFMHTFLSDHSRNGYDWRPDLDRLLGYQPIPGNPMWAFNRNMRGPRGWVCMTQHNMCDYRDSCVRISIAGVPEAGPWCPPLPAFDGMLQPLNVDVIGE